MVLQAGSEVISLDEFLVALHTAWKDGRFARLPDEIPTETGQSQGRPIGGAL